MRDYNKAIDISQKRVNEIRDEFLYGRSLNRIVSINASMMYGFVFVDVVRINTGLTTYRVIGEEKVK